MSATARAAPSDGIDAATAPKASPEVADTFLSSACRPMGTSDRSPLRSAAAYPGWYLASRRHASSSACCQCATSRSPSRPGSG